MRPRSFARSLFGLICLLPAGAAAAPDAPVARVPVEEFVLDNGIRFLIVQRPQAASVSAGWMARVGSADETPPHTGVSHLIEHLMFKGTRVVSGRQLEAERRILKDQDRLYSDIRKLEAKEATATRTERIRELRVQLDALRELGRKTAFLGEFSLLYSQAGATDLDATTLRDLTLYFVTVPPEKLELWFWLESDRLLNAVFREFYKEKSVVLEERRLRIDSRPTGAADERVESLFWGPGPYRWQALGRSEDLEGLDRPTTERFFRDHYTPGTLTAALVGPLDPERVRRLARRYFGRIPGHAGARPEPAAFAATPAATAAAECDCPPQARVLYPTVGFRHPDSYPLQVVAGVLNGRTGRLHRDLVLGSEIAFSASSMQHPLRRAGYFSFSAETRGDATPEDLVDAWNAQVDRLLREPVSEEEMLKVRNRITADAFRRLKEPSALMKQILIYDGLGSWREINEWAPKILSVTPAELREAARRYLAPDRRLVATYRRPPAPAGGGAGTGGRR